MGSYYVQFIACSQLKPEERSLVELEGECFEELIVM